MTRQSKFPGRKFTELVLDLSVRQESLEHLMNQHAILLDAVLAMLERGMEENSTTKHTTSNGGYSREEQNI